MRDYILTQKLLDLALKDANSRRIVRVKLLIGPFSQEREESIRLCWKDLARGSRGEGAQLYFEHMPVPWKCLNCSGASDLDEETSICSFCSDETTRGPSGDDVRLMSIELE
jgi:Zn finger protein HypA/HybF involved in hydrogenase expression